MLAARGSEERRTTARGLIAFPFSYLISKQARRNARKSVLDVCITVSDRNLYGIKNRERKVFTTRNVNTEKVNIKENAFISLKSIYLHHELFNFFYQDLTFHRSFPHTWIRIPKGHHQLDPFCRRRVASAFEFLFLHLYLLGNLVLTPEDRFRRKSFTKPHFPHHQSEAVHVHLGIVDFLFATYLWSHVPFCASIRSRYPGFKGGQPQVS